MRVAVKGIDGTDSVEVSLNRGVVVIRLKPENRVTLERVREAIRQNGFTPKEADVRVRGRVLDDSGRLALATPGMHVVFRLAGDSLVPGIIDELQRVRGQDVTIDGRVPPTAREGRERALLQVRMVSGTPP